MPLTVDTAEERRAGGLPTELSEIDSLQMTKTRRTRRNIEESDGTVIFSLERLLNGGTKLTLEPVNKLGKPCCTFMALVKCED
jgi:putative molybdenum carrier protein